MQTPAGYSLVIAAGWAVSLIALPVMGHLGDRAAAAGIGRRPLVLIAGVAMVPAALLLTTAGTVPVFALAWLLAQIPTALVVTAASSRLAQEAPPDFRGWAATAAGIAPVLATTIGAATTLAFSSMPSMLFIAPALVGLALIVPSTLLRTMTSVPNEGHAPQDTPGKSFYPWSLLTAVALAFSGLAVGRIYLVPLIESVSGGLSTERVSVLASTTLIIATLGALAGAAVTGYIARQDSRTVSAFTLFSLIAAVPLAGLALVSSISQIYVMGALLGFTIGAINSAVYAIFLHRYSQRIDQGRILGLIIAAETVPYVLVPLAAAAAQATVNAEIISALFAVGALLAVAAAIVTHLRLRDGRTRQQ